MLSSMPRPQICLHGRTEAGKGRGGSHTHTGKVLALFFSYIEGNDENFSRLS